MCTTKKRGVWTTLAAAFALVVLSACGGGGGADTGPATILITATEVDWTEGTGLAGGTFGIMGDDAANAQWRGLIRFPLGAVVGQNVIGAHLHISFLNKNGTPEGSTKLGALEFHRINDTGPLHHTNHGLGSLAHDTDSNLILIAPNTRYRIGLLVPTLSALAAFDDLKLRLQWTKAEDVANGVPDNIEAAGLGHAQQPPVLEVIIQP